MRSREPKTRRPESRSPYRRRAAEDAPTEGAATTVRDAGGVPFASFFEREALRRERRKYHRRVIVVSLLLHVFVFGGIAIYSALHVDELRGPAVDVKVFEPAAAAAKGYRDPAAAPVKPAGPEGP